MRDGSIYAKLTAPSLNFISRKPNRNKIPNIKFENTGFFRI